MAMMHVVRLMLSRPLALKKVGPEDAMCIDFASRLRVLTVENRLKAVWTHIPNEIGWRQQKKASQIIYALAKAMGMIVGASDYVFLWKGGCLAMEAKDQKGVQSPEQGDFEKWCHDRDVPYRIFRTADEGISILHEHNLIGER